MATLILKVTAQETHFGLDKDSDANNPPILNDVGQTIPGSKQTSLHELRAVLPYLRAYEWIPCHVSFSFFS
jgi:hypothetical protein